MSKSIVEGEKSFPVLIVQVGNGVRTELVPVKIPFSVIFKDSFPEVSFFGAESLKKWGSGCQDFRKICAEESVKHRQNQLKLAEGTRQLNQSIDIFNGKEFFTVSIILCK